MGKCGEQNGGATKLPESRVSQLLLLAPTAPPSNSNRRYLPPIVIVRGRRTGSSIHLSEEQDTGLDMRTWTPVLSRENSEACMPRMFSSGPASGCFLPYDVLHAKPSCSYPESLWRTYRDRIRVQQLGSLPMSVFVTSLL